jgi:hypothetical protein
MALEAIYQKPNTSRKHPDHKVYPYLLRGLVIDRPNQVWCADITPGSSPICAKIAATSADTPAFSASARANVV